MPELPHLSGKEVAIGTLRGALKQAGIPVEKFIETYKKR